GTSSPTERFINDVKSESASSSTNNILVTRKLGFNATDTANVGGTSYVDIWSWTLRPSPIAFPCALV
ncbi:hypothetical protein LTR25_011202, partial [Vermiconidia calcicola]